MHPVEELVDSFQDLVAQGPDTAQRLIALLAGMISFIEGEGGALIGVVGGLDPAPAGAAASTGNLLCVLVVVLVISRARQALVSSRDERATATT